MIIYTRLRKIYKWVVYFVVLEKMTSIRNHYSRKQKQIYRLLNHKLIRNIRKQKESHWENNSEERSGTSTTKACY